jgi:hypothetical protein
MILPLDRKSSRSENNQAHSNHLSYAQDEMVEAKHQLQLARALTRCTRYDLIALDEYMPLAEVGAEFLFQVIAEQAKKARKWQ